MRGKHPTKAAACCNGEKLFFMERWIAVVPAKDVQVEINHFIKLFGVKSRKEGIVEAGPSDWICNCRKVRYQNSIK